MFIATQKVSFVMTGNSHFTHKEQKSWRGVSEILSAGCTFKSPEGLFKNPVIPKYSRLDWNPWAK